MNSSHLIKNLKLWLGPFSVCPRLQWRDLQQRADLALSDLSRNQWEYSKMPLPSKSQSPAKLGNIRVMLLHCCIRSAEVQFSGASLFFIIEQIQVRFTSSIKFGLFLHLFRWTSKITVHITGIANTCFYRSVAYRHAQLESLFILYYL